MRQLCPSHSLIWGAPSENPEHHSATSRISHLLCFKFNSESYHCRTCTCIYKSFLVAWQGIESPLSKSTLTIWTIHNGIDTIPHFFDEMECFPYHRLIKLWCMSGHVQYYVQFLSLLFPSKSSIHKQMWYDSPSNLLLFHCWLCTESFLTYCSIHNCKASQAQ